MGFKSDIEIAQECVMEPITKIAEKAGIDEKYLEQYGKYKAKIDYNLLNESDAPNGKLILVTAINPTPAGEGKTTTTVGLADGMQKLGKKVMVALREPSLGPVFGVKGGAAGGGYAQVVPMEDINLHFTGDFHAIGAANNLLAAMLDNHIYQGNELNIDPRKITWRRCVDMNDRQLRFVVDGLGGKTNGKPREDGYDITVASEIMAVLCLASDITDLKARLGRIIVGYTYGKASEEKPVTAHDLHAEGAMCALLKDALKPNLVQTLEHVPAIVHGGPFANIELGLNSADWIQADKLFEGNSDETEVYYYRYPVPAGQSTSELLETIGIPADLTNEYADKTVHLEAVADGVQFAGADANELNASGILASWGVSAQLDENGNLVSVTE